MVPETATGREWGESDSIAPITITSSGRTVRSALTSDWLKARHRKFGSGPCTSTRSRLGRCAIDNRNAGQMISLCEPSLTTIGRFTWKS